jgi:hypothetical protein
MGEVVNMSESYRYRPPSKYFVDINRPALAKATNGWLALALYLFSLEEETAISEAAPALAKAGQKLAEVTKAMTRNPGESLLQSLTGFPFPEPIAYGAPSFYQPMQQQRQEQKKGIIGKIKEALFGEE